MIKDRHVHYIINIKTDWYMVLNSIDFVIK